MGEIEEEMKRLGMEEEIKLVKKCLKNEIEVAENEEEEDEKEEDGCE